MIHVVIGPPCAGKSTFVRENATAGDVIVDYDQLAQALGADASHEAEGAIRSAAFEARDAIIKHLIDEDHTGWIIHTRPNSDQMKAYEDAAATFHVIDPGLDVCLERAEADGRPAGTSDVITRWYDDPPEIPTIDHEPAKHGGFSHASKEGATMKIKMTPLAGVKAGPDDGLADGEFLVYPSTFTKTPDAYGDIVAPGAFTDTIQAWKDSGDTLPGLYGHRMDDPDFFVAGALDMGEDDHGWWVKGEFDLDNPKAKQVYRLVKGRRLRQLSFAYDVLDEGSTTLEDGTKVNELRKLHVHEFSFVPVGANPDTSVVAIKQIADAVAVDMKAGRVLAQKHIDSLRSAQEAIGRVITAAEGDQEDEKANASTVVSPDEEPRGVKSQSTPQDIASVEAILAVIEIEEKG